MNHFIINIIVIIGITTVIFNNQANLRAYLLKLYQHSGFNFIAIIHFHFKLTSFTFMIQSFFFKASSFLKDISCTNLVVVSLFIILINQDIDSN